MLKKQFDLYNIIKYFESKIVKLIFAFGFVSFRRFFYQKSVSTKTSIKLKINATSFDNNDKKKGKILLIGNANVNIKLGHLVDSFDGDVARFNRFQDGYENYIGSKTTLWFVSRNITEKNVLNSYYKYNSAKIIEMYSLQNGIIIMTYMVSQTDYKSLLKKIKTFDHLSAYDTRKSTILYREFAEQYKSQGGIIVDKENMFYKKNGMPKPTTGITSILYSILNYEEVYIFNFDFGKSDHYWGRENISDLVVGVHNFVLDELIVDLLVENDLVRWLS